MDPPDLKSLRAFSISHPCLGIVVIAVNALTAYITFRHSGQQCATYRYFLLFLQFWTFGADAYACFAVTTLFPLLPTPCGYADGVLFSAIGLGVRLSYAVYVAFQVANVFSYALCFLYRYQVVTFIGTFTSNNKNHCKISPYRAEQALLGILTVHIVAAPILIAVAKLPEYDRSLIMNDNFYRWSTDVLDHVDCIDTKFLAAFVVVTTILVVLSSLFLSTICLHTFYILSHTQSLSERTKTFHRMMMKNLVIQMSVPTTFFTIPITFIIAQYFMGIQSIVGNLASYHVMTLHSSVHCATLLITTPSYREAIRRMVSTTYNTSAVTSLHEKTVSVVERNVPA